MSTRRRWSTSRPTTPGYYWVREHAHDEVPYLVKVTSGSPFIATRLASDGLDRAMMFEVTARWWGPLIPPMIGARV